jgi:hypothetical protein
MQALPLAIRSSGNDQAVAFATRDAVAAPAPGALNQGR